MLDNISGQIFRKKALDRWENEGGRVCADRTGSHKSGSPETRADKDHARADIEKSDSRQIRN